MGFAKQKAIPLLLLLSLLIHRFPVNDKFLLNPASNMEIQLTIFKITLKQHALFPLIFANMTDEALSLFVQLALDFSIIDVLIPDLRDPIYTGQVGPSQIIFCNHTLNVVAEHALYTKRFQLMLF
jgi:hypothetical protein